MLWTCESLTLLLVFDWKASKILNCDGLSSSNKKETTAISLWETNVLVWNAILGQDDLHFTIRGLLFSWWMVECYNKGFLISLTGSVFSLIWHALTLRKWFSKSDLSPLRYPPTHNCFLLVRKARVHRQSGIHAQLDFLSWALAQKWPTVTLSFKFLFPVIVYWCCILTVSFMLGLVLEFYDVISWHNYLQVWEFPPTAG